MSTARREVLAAGGLGVTALVLPPAAAAASPSGPAGLAGDAALQLYLDAGYATSYGGNGATWTDLSGAGRDATLHGDPTYVAGATATSSYLRFAGTLGQYAATDPEDTFGDLSSWTIETWARVPGGAGSLTGRGTAVVTEVFASSTANLALRIDSSRLQAALHPDSGDWQAVTGWSPDGLWHHHVATFDGTNLTQYLDGVQVAGTTFVEPVTATSSGGGIRIARRWDDAGAADAASNYAPVDVGLVRISSVALTASEVQANFTATRSRYEETVPALAGDADLRLYLDADLDPSYIGAGTTWYDLSARSGNATLHGATYVPGGPGGGGHFSFSGTMGSYAVTAPLGDLPNWTVEVWARVPGGPASLTGRETAVVTDMFGGNARINFALRIVSSGVAPAFYTGSWIGVAGWSPDTVWHHHVVTFDGSISSGGTVRHYLDGVLLQSTSTGATGTISGGSGFRLARRWDNGTGDRDSNYAPVDIGLVRISAGALSAADVLANHDATKGRYLAGS